VRADFPHTAYRWSVRIRRYANAWTAKPSLRLLTGVTPSRRAAEGGRHPCADWPHPQSMLRVARFDAERRLSGVIGTGPAGHALARSHFIDETRAGVLPSRRVIRRGVQQYYDPLGLPLRTTRFHHRLIRVALPRPGPRRRASRVPFVSLHACCSPYPAETPCAYTSGQGRRRHGLRRDMTGSALGL